MEALGKGNIRNMLRDYLYGEIEDYISSCRGIGCPEGWRSEVRGIARRALELLFTHDEAEITEVEQYGTSLRFTYILRGYGMGEAANVEFERDGYDYLRIRFSVLRDGRVSAMATYERQDGDVSLNYRRQNGEFVYVRGDTETAISGISVVWAV